MLVDLGRNDSRASAGRAPSRSRVPRAERYSHVTHLVSQVAGDLRDGVSHVRPAARCFPAGTVSGAPKVRAMQLISELEGHAAGPTRAPSATRSRRKAARHVHRDQDDRPRGRRRALQAGAGIVADSDPRPSTRSACASSRPSKRRSTSRRQSSVDPPDRQLRLVHVQPRASLRRVRRRGHRAPKRCDRRRTRQRLAPSHLVISPGPGRPADAGARRRSCGASRKARRRSGSASGTR